MELRLMRLGLGDRDRARALFRLMAAVFEEECQPLSDRYLDGLLGLREFWAIAALVGEQIVGGITAHTLPMTRSESFEIFIYDVAVQEEQQRKGIGRELLNRLRAEAAAVGIGELFVPADDEDLHALDFYRALGGVAARVTIFSFSSSVASEAMPKR